MSISPTRLSPSDDRDDDPQQAQAADAAEQPRQDGLEVADGQVEQDGAAEEEQAGSPQPLQGARHGVLVVAHAR